MRRPCSCSATSILRSSPSAGPSKRTPIWPTTATRKPRSRSRRSPAAAGCVEVERILGRGRKPFLKKGFSFPSPNPGPAAQPTPSSPKAFLNGAHGDHVSAAAFTLAAVSRRRLLSFNARRLLLQKVFSLAGGVMPQPPNALFPTGESHETNPHRHTDGAYAPRGWTRRRTRRIARRC